MREGTRETYTWAIVALTPVLYDKYVRSIAGTYPDKKRTRLIDGPVLKDGMAPFSWHDLRRICGCRLLQGQRATELGSHPKLAMEEVSKWLGHSSISVTERHYAFLTVDTLT